jgi:hypothetical protein
VMFAAHMKFSHALSLTPAVSHPMGEGETLGRTRQRSHACVFLGHKSETFFRWFLRLLSETQPRSVRFSRPAVRKNYAESEKKFVP